MSKRSPAEKRTGKGKHRRKARRDPNPDEIQHLVGLCRDSRHAAAREAARSFTERWPDLAVGWNALAASCDALGARDDAARAYRRAVRIEPQNAGAWNNLGNVLRATGETAGAVDAFRHALEYGGEQLEFRYNLGLALLDRGSAREALEAFDRVLQSRPGLADALNARGNALRALGRTDEAIEAHREAVEAAPRNPELRNNLGCALEAAGRVQAAEATFREALEQRPDHPDVPLNLALLLLHRQRADEAEAVLEGLLARHPRSGAGLHNLGHLLAETGRAGEAEARYREALAIDPTLAATHQSLGNLLLDRNELEAAEAEHREALALRPTSPQAHRDLGIVLSVLGRTGEAEQCYREALALQPDYAPAYAYLASIKRFEANDADLAAIEALLARDDLADDDRCSLHYAAARAHDQIGSGPAQVFEHVGAGARIKRATFDYDIAADEAGFERIAAACDGARGAPHAGAGDPTPAPIFIVGMPRSGTTLVEQILASHPSVHGADERSDLARVVADQDRATGQAFPDWLADLDDATATDLGGAYRAAVVDTAPAARVTDKMPENFRFLGVIPRILPRARIVHVRREPADTCLSCYLHLFLDKARWSYDLGELGRFYRAYDRLMQHWHEVLPGDRLLELRYEDLVAAPEAQIRRLLDFCDLDWDPACLAFHATRRAVPTPSLVQVREPVYDRSVGRWRRYADGLGPLFEALGPLAPGRAAD